jgi:hypothetical protein
MTLITSIIHVIPTIPRHNRNDSIPPRSIANNLWIGDPSASMRRLTLPGRLLTNPIRNRIFVLKLKNWADPSTKQRGVKGSCISFPQKNPLADNPFMLTRADDPNTDKDDSVPRLTIFAAIDSVHKQPDYKTLYIKTCIEIAEAGGSLTVPICSTQDCYNQCGYDSDIGPFTCNDHGIVTPHVISRPTAKVVIKTQDNRHDHKDEDITINCTIAKGQEAVYLGMTLDGLMENNIDVDKVRDNLKGQRFHCTLAISRTAITAIRLQRDHKT